MDQLLLILRFYATGAFQQVLGDTINVHKSTVSRIVHRVTTNIASLARRYINMPHERPIVDQVVREFYEMAGMPCVIGAIDCIHIKIVSGR